MATKNYKITIAGQTYDVQVGDISTSPVEVSVDGATYEVEIPDVVAPSTPDPPSISAPKTVAPAPQAISRPAVPTSGGDGVVRSPMPGKIVSVNVTTGATVTKGQPILILESMKMENTIASPIDGTVSAVLVAAGDVVQHGQTLAEIAQA
ncbi:MAG: biotin/lipoyl-binding protein [Chloroflexi bacterium]|nr:biotin/lipoyl-binding protein [Chloroflexota bacterium]MBT3863255.1 biotin/lipoyl-binding protein [Chloroflexota bacterium]MBT4141604.1 biotin/lipoyl-binding protein [Chloroflexota bacterium]MBT4341110.1 biotin/lipoyl-binding protein [Chloroflexota bacterium]MBT4944293.1 biotin/lipoyl-binding protein [Chloroflexota bacterium]